MHARWTPLPFLIAVTTYAGTLEDMDLRRNVEAAIRGSAPTANLHLKVEVKDGIVLPEGIVRDLVQADEVVERAGSIKGVLGVARAGFRFEYAGEPDERIASRVSRTLLEVAHLATSSIRVDVRGGIVTLEGTLGNASHRGEIRRLCGAAPGVVEVVDHTVSPESPDATIQKALDGVFGRRVQPRFPGSVEALVDHGAVVLSGTVPRLNAKSLAVRTAWAINGVRTVVDDLRIDVSPRIKVVRP